MGSKLSRSERAWAAERLVRLGRMIDALDSDLPGVPPGEWVEFWTDMRRLYTKARVYLSTGLETDDLRCLRSGRTMWQKLETLIQVAERRLEG
ncbi:MAG: hypothetical protein ACE5HD_05225 [Acidobacteriota bacterium]